MVNKSHARGESPPDSCTWKPTSLVEQLKGDLYVYSSSLLVSNIVCDASTEHSSISPGLMRAIAALKHA